MGWFLVPVVNFIVFTILQRGKKESDGGGGGGGGMFSIQGSGGGHPVVKTISNYFKIDAYVYLAHSAVVMSSAWGFDLLKQIQFAQIVSKVG
eukprot:12121081-Ditylum_brightwellii.AAC.1